MRNLRHKPRLDRKDGKVKAKAFRDAFRKTVTPFVSIRSAQ